MKSGVKKMTYYKEIDGLRAFAVLSVVLYHLDFSFVPGGFIGVDIFFVISGFLITKSIRSDIEANTYTITGFYNRRIRRIVPALFFVVISVTLFAHYILPGSELKEYYKSVFSVSTFTSNFFFWKYSDYFSTASELKPLLHTWSLGIEEQFYILFPIFMLLTRKLADKFIITLLLIIALASFVLSLPSIGVSDPVATFYLPLTRFWELLVGSLLAVNLLKMPFKGAALNNIASLSGLVLVISSIVLLGDNSFSGISALYAVLGTALIIYSGNSKTILSAALTNRFVVYLGLISYSLYLWHWPIIALVKNSMTGELDIATTQLLIIGLTFVLSAFTYTFIEQPFRKVTRFKEFLRIRTGIAALAFLSVVSGSILYAMGSKNSETQELAEPDDSPCFFTGKETLKSTERCSFGVLDTDKIFLLYGDSHTNAFAPVFMKFAADNGYRGIMARSGGCAPVFGVFRRDGVQASGCTGKFSENVRNFLYENKESIDMIYLVSRWTLYEKGWIMNGRLQKATHYLSDNETTTLVAAQSAKVLKKALLRTVDEMTSTLGLKITIIPPVPDLPTHIRNLKHEVTRESYIEQRFFVDKIFKTFEANPLVKFIDPIDVLCDADICRAYADDGTTRLYRDDNHLNYRGALLFYPYLMGTME